MDLTLPLVITVDSPAYSYEYLDTFLRSGGKIQSVALDWYKKYLTVKQAFSIAMDELQYSINDRWNSKLWRAGELYTKYFGAKSWEGYGTAFTKALNLANTKARAKAKQVLGGIMRQSPLLRFALKKSMTFYREDGTQVTVESQKSAKDIYDILKQYYPTTAAVQGLARMIRNQRGSFVGWTLTEPYNPNQKYLYTEVTNIHAKPEVDMKVLTLEERSEYPEQQKAVGVHAYTGLKYACELKENVIDLSKVLDPVVNPIKGGRTLKACLEKVMVLTKGDTSIIIKGAKNLAVIARETEISLSALRHLVYQRCLTANGWSLSVHR